MTHEGFCFYKKYFLVDFLLITCYAIAVSKAISCLLIVTLRSDVQSKTKVNRRNKP